MDSPLRGAIVDSVVVQSTGMTTELRQILFSDYTATSPLEVKTCDWYSSSFCGHTSDLFQYQRIEGEWIFGSLGNAHRVHVMSRAQCTRYINMYGKYDYDENNRLALSGDYYAFYDPLPGSIPVINIKAISSPPFQHGTENRFKVSCSFQKGILYA